MEESYIVRVYRREQREIIAADPELEERISGMVEDIKRNVRKPFHTAEELWRLISVRNEAAE
jgi:hypothetical protein